MYFTFTSKVSPYLQKVVQEPANYGSVLGSEGWLRFTDAIKLYIILLWTFISVSHRPIP